MSIYSSRVEDWGVVRNLPRPILDFELSINDIYGPDNGITMEGIVTSPALDPQMHPDGKLEVFIYTRRNTKDAKKGCVIDSFHINSLLAYLNGQAKIRKVLERVLAVDQEKVDPEGEPVRGDVWSWAEVDSLELTLRDRRKRSRTAKTLFNLGIKCDWWPDGSQNAAFVDGKFVGFE